MRKTARQIENEKPDQDLVVIATAGEVLPDGTMVELVRDPGDPMQAALLHWDGQRETISSELIFGSKRFVPIEINGGFVEQLPSLIEPYGSTDELFHDVHVFIAKFSGLGEEESTLATHFSFASSFCDCLAMCPCLLLYGSSPADAIATLRTLGDVCRHPVLLADSGGALPERFMPTRLICQPDGRVNQLLAALQFAGFGISQNGRLRDTSGATAIYIGDVPLKSPFADACLWLPVAPARRVFFTQEARLEAESLRNRLLSYRLDNYSKVKSSSFDASQFFGSTRELARAFGACVVDSSDLQKRLVELLQEYDEASRVERTNRMPSIVVEALRACCHERRTAIHAGEVAKMASLMLSRQGEFAQLSARKIGTILKRLGFRTTKLDAGGRGIYLLNGECARIHKLASGCGLPSLSEQFPGCPYCQLTST